VKANVKACVKASATLRSTTADLHERVDARVRRFLAKGVEGCRDFLRVSQGIVVPWEQELRRFSWPEALRVNDRLCKSAWLEEDIGQFASSQIAKAGRVSANAANAAEAWGALYVFEGSTLGAVVIAKVVEDASFRYLQGYGAETQAMWRSMKVILDDVIRSEEDLAGSVTAARRMFAQFEEELS
jgi:heme oxygenase